MEKSNEHSYRLSGINVFPTRKRLFFTDLEKLSQPNTSRDTQTTFSSNDSFQVKADDWWNNVSDESFLNVERQCDASYEEEQEFSSFGQSGTKLPEKYSCLDETIVYERPGRLSTIYESSIENVNSGDASTETFSSTKLVQYGDEPAIVPVPSILINDSFAEASTSNLDNNCDHFNDTLGAVNCFMKHGKKIMEKTYSSASSSVPNQDLVGLSPNNSN